MQNIIFDIGNVLLSYQPLQFLLQHYDEDTSKDLKHIVFDSPLWLNLDEGTLTNEEVIHILSHQYPMYSSEIHFVINHWCEMLTPIKKNVDILVTLKDQYKIYLLSNFHTPAFDYMYEKYDFLRNIDGMIISSRVKLLKPDVRIYQTLLNTYQLNPSECIFIDDSLSNVETAQSLGILGIHLPLDCDLKKECIKAGLDI